MSLCTQPKCVAPEASGGKRTALHCGCPLARMAGRTEQGRGAGVFVLRSPRRCHDPGSLCGAHPSRTLSLGMPLRFGVDDRQRYGVAWTLTSPGDKDICARGSRRGERALSQDTSSPSPRPHSCLAPSGLGHSQSLCLSTVDLGGQVLLCWGLSCAWQVGQQPGHHLLDAASIRPTPTVTIKNVSRHWQVSPGDKSA